MILTKSYAAFQANEDLKPYQFDRRELRADDILIDISYCGVCHSDLHTVNNDWKGTKYPIVPGHEIIGKVAAIGNQVSTFKIGDTIGVGCMVDSCQTCSACQADTEQYCSQGFTPTYNGKDRIDQVFTQGGYSDKIIVREKFCLHIPNNINLKDAAPLLCAGITTWSPLSHWNIKAGDTVGIIGLGGLGHMGVKFAHALKAHVVMITSSESKGEDAKKLGADEVLISSDKEAMKKNRGQFDFLLNTIPVNHDANPYIKLLKTDGVMVFVGAIEPIDSIDIGQLVIKRKTIAGSLIGGIKETQEMLDFCGKHNIASDVEVIPIQDINKAYERMKKGDVKYRFVIDMQSLKSEV